MAQRPFPLEAFKDFPAKGHSMVSPGSSSAMDPFLVDASEDIPSVTEEPSKKATRGFPFSKSVAPAWRLLAKKTMQKTW